MAHTTNYSLPLPQLGEPADIRVLDQGTEMIDGIMHGNRTMVAPAWVSTETYNTGSRVVYLGEYYKCKEDNVTGAWDATKWDKTTVGEDIEGLGTGGASALADLDDVEITSPTEGQALLYDDSDDKWKNGTLPDPSVVKEVTGNPIEITDAAAAPIVKCVTQITGYQEGTGTPSPDNIRPIVAYTEGEIEVKGKNLFNKNAVTNNRRVSGSAGNVYTYNGYCVSNLIKVKPNTTYTKITGGDSYFAFYATGGTYISGGAWLDNGIRIAPSNAVYLRIDMSMTNVDIGIIVEGSTINEYEPYTSTTHTTTYPSAIYRGSEDVVGGTATTEWGMIASYAGETLPGEWISDRDEYVPGTTPTTGAQVAYELAAPTTTSVTPTNLPIRTLSGYNHIESSTGDMEVEYISGNYQALVDLIQSSSHVYSTAEQVVGKWINNENLYERIIVFPNVTIDGGGSDYKYKGDLMIRSIIPDADIILPDTQHSYYVLNSDQFSFIGLRINCTTGELVVVTLFSVTNADLHICLQYTKSTQTRSLSAPLTSQKAQIEPLTDKTEEVPTEEEKAVETPVEEPETEEENEEER